MSKLALNDVNIFYGDFHAVQNVNMQIPAQAVTAFIGPSGCGKSTVLRTLNRMHEVIAGAHWRNPTRWHQYLRTEGRPGIRTQHHRHGLPEG